MEQDARQHNATYKAAAQFHPAGGFDPRFRMLIWH
jgi:hypothetical protein